MQEVELKRATMQQIAEQEEAGKAKLAALKAKEQQAVRRPNATLLALLPALALGATAAAWAPRFAALRAARRDASERVESSLRLQTFFKARRARARAPCRGRRGRS